MPLVRTRRSLTGAPSVSPVSRDPQGVDSIPGNSDLSEIEPEFRDVSRGPGVTTTGPPRDSCSARA
jgi:hypothetical protein